MERNIRLSSNRYEKKDAMRLWIFAAITSILILFGTMHFIFSVMALGFLAVLAVFGDNKDFIVLVVLITPFANIFKMSPGSVSFHTYVVLLFAIKDCLLRKKVNAYVVLFMCYFVFLQMLTSSFDWKSTMKMGANLLFLSIAYDTYENQDATALFYGFIIGVINSSVFRLMDSNVFRVTRYVEVEALNRMYGIADGVRFSGCVDDPNYYAVNVIIALCLMVLLLQKRKIPKPVALGITGAMVYFSYLTYSKSAMIMLLYPFAFFLYMNGMQRRQGVVFGTIVAVLVGGSLFISKNPEVFSVVIARMSEGEGEGLNALTTGRTDIWVSYFMYFLAHPIKTLLGSGLIGYVSEVNRRAAHNTYIELIYHLGIIGSALLLTSLKNIQLGTSPNRNRDLSNYVVLGCIVIMYAFLSQVFMIDAPIHLLLAFINLNMPGLKRKTASNGIRSEGANA